MTKIDKSFGNLDKSEDQKYLETLMADMGVQDLNELSPSERKAFINAAKPTYKMKRKAKIKEYFKLSSKKINRKGHLVSIGGAEDRSYNSVILKKIIDLSGGRGSRIIIIPSASRMNDAGMDYLNTFSKMGANAVIKRPSDNDFKDSIKNCSSIFFTGGDQNRLAKIIYDKNLKDIILKNYFSGMNICGSSAGAAYISKNMISGGDESSLVIKSGLGALDNVIIDQHFTKRKRKNRLIEAIKRNPESVGIGIDENTSIAISPTNLVKVYGSGKVFVFYKNSSILLKEGQEFNLNKIGEV